MSKYPGREDERHTQNDAAVTQGHLVLQRRSRHHRQVNICSTKPTTNSRYPLTDITAINMSKPIILLLLTGPEYSSDLEIPVNTWLTQTRGPSVKRNSRPATQKLSYSCMGTEVHHCVHKTIPLVILILINSVYTLRSNFHNELAPYNLHIYNQVSNVISSLPIFRLKWSPHYSFFLCGSF